MRVRDHTNCVTGYVVQNLVPKKFYRSIVNVRLFIPKPHARPRMRYVKNVINRLFYPKCQLCAEPRLNLFE